jgi:ectoine hydroxylase-related dioxygenase (phytanoyl-CoA dioxygenase family)
MSITPALHPLNRGFAFGEIAPPFAALTVEQADAWNRDGAFAARGLLTAREVAAVRAAIDPHEARTEAFLASRENGTHGIARAGEISFTVHLVREAPLLADVAGHPAIARLMGDLIGPDVRLYWDQAVYKKPGTREEFPWHQDNGYTFVEPQQYVTCWLALTEATEDNGCPWIVPGLHRLGTLEHRITRLGFRCLEDAPGAQPIELAPGDAAVFSSLTPHRTGPNLTDEVRAAYILQYAPDGARAFPAGGGRPQPCDDPQRQFPVLVDGRPVATDG